MRSKVQLEIRDVYGGDGIVRTEERAKTTLRRARREKSKRESIGVEINDSVDQEMSEVKTQAINTFRRDENGRPMLRFGGAHGKLWGAMRACAKQLRELGDVDFSKYSTLMDMIQVSPAWVVLETEDPVHTDGIPQQMAGGRSMIITYYDVIPKARVELELIFPHEIQRKILKLLAQLQIGTHLNKRRAIIKVLNIITEA